jgi:ABC-2 type transport system ATP-binding protein
MYGIHSKPARERGLQLLDALGLGDRAHRRAATLSGGMKRRLNLLLALAHDPSVVLLDEPEAGLDPQSRVLVREFVRGLAHRKTVILTSHNMDEVDRVADRVGILNEGRLLVVDTPENIKRNTGAGDALRVEIEPVDEALRASGLGALKAIDANGTPVSVSVELEAQVFTVRCSHVVDVVADAVNALKALGFHIRSLSIRENTLEDAFISLTGRSLASESAETVS